MLNTALPVISDVCDRIMQKGYRVSILCGIAVLREKLAVLRY